MSHGNDDDTVIILNNQEEIDKLPEDKQEKIRDILEKANKEIDKVLNPNL